MAPVVLVCSLAIVEHTFSMTVEVAVPKKLRIVAFVAQMPLSTFLIVWKFLNLKCWPGPMRIYLFLSP